MGLLSPSLGVNEPNLLHFRQLCLLLSAEDIYRCCSEILLFEEDMRFASHMIQTLSTILLTSTELFELRMQLKDLKTEVSV